MLYLEPQPRLYDLHHEYPRYPDRRPYVIGRPKAKRYQLEHALRHIDDYTYIGSSVGIATGLVAGFMFFSLITRFLIRSAELAKSSDDAVLCYMFAVLPLGAALWLGFRAGVWLKAIYQELRAKCASSDFIAVIDTKNDERWKLLLRTLYPLDLSLGLNDYRRPRFEHHLIDEDELAWLLKPHIDKYLVETGELYELLARDTVSKQHRTELKTRVQEIAATTAATLKKIIADYEQPAIEAAQRKASDEEVRKAGENAAQDFLRKQAEQTTAYDVEAALGRSADFLTQNKPFTT